MTTTLTPTLPREGVELTPSQLEPIGWFLLAVLEWEDPTPPPTPPHRKSIDGEGGRRKRKAVCVSSPVA